MKTWDEPKKLVAVICVLCFPPSLCPSNPTPTLLSRKLHIPPPLLTPHHHVPQCLHFPRPTLTNPSCHPPPLLQHPFPALLSPGPPVQPLFPHSPPLWQSARPSSCTPHSFCWPVLSLHLSPPFLPSFPHEHLLSCLHFQQKHLCACSLLPDLRPRLTYTWKKQELSLQG